MGSLQRAGVRDLPRTARWAVASRPSGSPTRRSGIAERLGHHGAAFLVLMDRIRRGGNALRPAPRWRHSVRRFWISVSGAGCRIATSATSTWAWPRTGEATPNAPRPSCATPSSWSRRVRSLGRAVRCWRATWPTKAAPTRLWDSSSLPSRSRSCPGSTGSTASARGAACSASLRRSTCVACTSRPHHWRRWWKGCVELGRRWITYDGRLVETRAGLVAAAARRWEEAEREFAIASDIAEQMSNRLELADLRRLHARMLLDRGKQWRLRSRRRDVGGGFVRLPHVRHARLRRGGRTAAESGAALAVQSCQQWRTPSKIICASQVGQRNERSS